MLEKLSAALGVELDKESIGIDLGKWLLQKREELKLTRKDLAEKAGISSLTIYFIENGTIRSPREATLKGLEKAIGRFPSSLRKDVEKARDIGSFEYLGPFPLRDWQEHVDSEEKIPCIYVFYDALSRPVRIGETIDLKRRIREHEQAFWFKSPMAVTFAYIIIPDKTFREQAEKVMIKLVGQHAIFNVQETI
jgi:transcriptional regulator with XRE-family HTH domain